MTGRHGERLGAILAAAVVVAASCGSGGKAQSSTSPSSLSTGTANQTSSPIASPTPTPSPTPSLSPTPTPSPQLVVKLNVAFGSAFYGLRGNAHCPNELLHVDNVVLVQNRLTYTADEISRMAGVETAAESGDGSQLDPSLLAVRPGVPTAIAPTGYTDFGGAFTGPNCLFVIEVTNAGGNTVQISRVGLRVTAPAAANDAPYRLVEVCSVIKATHDCPPPIGHGGLPCSVFGVAVALHDSPPGSEFFGTPAQKDLNTGQPCPPPVLQPQGSVTFVLGVYSQSGLIYRAAPSLDLITGTAHGTVAFAQLDSAFAFADITHFSCYKLSGSTFQLLWQGSAALPGPTSGWCA